MEVGTMERGSLDLVPYSDLYSSIVLISAALLNLNHALGVVTRHC